MSGTVSAPGADSGLWESAVAQIVGIGAADIERHVGASHGFGSYGKAHGQNGTVRGYPLAAGYIKHGLIGQVESGAEIWDNLRFLN